MASRITTSSLSLAEAAPKHLLHNRLAVFQLDELANLHGISRVNVASCASCREKNVLFHAELTQTI